VRSALLALALVAASSPLAAAPLLGTDHAVDTPVVAPTLFDQQTPALAYGAGVYFAVWRDGDKNVGQVWSLKGVRFDSTGKLLDDPPLVISDAGELLTNPSVGFDGTNFLVAWEWPNPTKGSASVRAVWIDPATGVVGTPFLAVDSTGSQTQPSVTGGDGYALVAATSASGADANSFVRATLYGSGTPILSNFPISTTVLPSTDPSPAIAPSVAFSGAAAGHFLVAWGHGNSQSEGVRAAAVDLSGNVSTPVKVSPSVTCTGNGDCISGMCNTAVGVCSCSTDPDCAPGTCGFSVCNLGATEPSVAWDGTRFGVVWSDRRSQQFRPDLYGRAVSAGGATAGTEFVVSTAPASTAGYQRSQLVSVSGQLITLAEQVQTDGTSFLYGARLDAGAGTSMDPNGTLLSSAAASPYPLLPADGDSRRIGIATDATKAYAAWALSSGGPTGDDVYALPIDPASFTAHASVLATQERNFERTRTVATDGSVYMFVWEDDRNSATTGLDVYGLRVKRDGTPIDNAPLLISFATGTPTQGAAGDQFAPVVAATSGGDFLVVWSDSRNLATGQKGIDLYGARVPASGAPVQLTQPISTANFAQVSPAVAASPTGWLVTWQDWRSINTSPGTSQLFAAFVPKVDPGVSPTEHQITVKSNAYPTACAAVPVWDGQRFFVAWEQPCSQIPGGAAADVFGQWMTSTGTLMGSAIIVADRTGPETAPALTTDGNGTVFIAWRDQTVKEAIFGGAIASGAAVLNGPAVSLFVDNGSREAPAISWAPGGAGTLMLSFIETVPGRAAGMRFRADASFTPIDVAPFTLVSGSTFRVPLGTVAPDALGRGAIGAPMSTPPAALATQATGDTLTVYALLENRLARAHWRAFGVLPPGLPCAMAGGCADGFCTGGACCDAPCDGVCQACGSNGCVETPATDVRCNTGPDGGALSCASLSTACRTFTDLPAAANQCVAFGQCAQPGQCTAFVDAPDGTACPAADCGGMGACMAGICACAGQTPPHLPARAAPAGCACTVGGHEEPSGLAWLLIVALLLYRRFRSSAA
jgi:MYXO-CTERM domain-containing protein